MTAVGKLKIDPATLEIIDHKLSEITEEMALTLRRVSGSVVVQEANDFNLAILTPIGEFVTIGSFNIGLSASLGFITKYIVENIKDVNPDDQFISNDPYLPGNTHHNDINMIAPFHYNGRIRAYVTSCLHVMDIGGKDPGSFCIGANDAFQEGLRIPIVKIVEKGKFRDDILNLISRNSRMPKHLGLDIKGMVAANNLAKNLLKELFDSFGEEIILAAFESLIDQSEQLLRARLRELPNGVFRCCRFMEHDGTKRRRVKIMFTVTKKDDTLTIDFTGTSPQGGFRTASLVATWTSIMKAFLPTLCYDIPWTEGVFKPLKVIAPKGTMVNAQFPNPVSYGHLSTGLAITSGLTEIISRILLASKKYKKDVNAPWAGSIPLTSLGGLNKDGEMFGVTLGEAPCLGGGARTYRDGVDSAGEMGIIQGLISDVEIEEAVFPILILYRKHLQNSGGAGKYRGGLGIRQAMMPYKAPYFTFAAVPASRDFPTAPGLAGGLPANAQLHKLIKSSNIFQRLGQGDPPENIEELCGELVLCDPVVNPPMILSPNDIFEFYTSGGGGYGDPLERDPYLVLKDVEDKKITLEIAEKIYGVYIDKTKKELNLEKTEILRENIRKTRIQNSKRKIKNKMMPFLGKKPVEVLTLSEYLSIVRTDNDELFYQCNKCGYLLCAAKESPKDYMGVIEIPPEECGTIQVPRQHLWEPVIIREFICPQCGTLFTAEVTLSNEEIVPDLEIELENLFK
ncbi:MAG: hydantoinase B/oxoprolinase family protein [Candidatus Bathyarchaeia archaeon]